MNTYSTRGTCSLRIKFEVDNNIIKYVESKSVELEKLQSPYKSVSKKKVPFYISIAKKLPLRVRLALHELTRKQKYSFIEK